jgi:hypothetical protein
VPDQSYRIISDHHYWQLSLRARRRLCGSQFLEVIERVCCSYML